MSDLPRMLTRYKAWADDLTYAMVAAQPLEEIVKERETTFKTIGHTLQHIQIVDEIFRAHLEGRAHGYAARTVEDLPPIGELHRRASALNSWWVELTERLTEQAMAETVEFEFVDGGRGAMTRLQIILHVVQHATYHRGYVDDMMYQIPAVPPATDLTVFLNGGR